jgi:hypothetical protein
LVYFRVIKIRVAFMIRSLLGNTSFPYAQQHVLFSAKEKQRENREAGLEKTSSAFSNTSTPAEETAQRNKPGQKGTSAGAWMKRAGLFALAITASATGASARPVSEKATKAEKTKKVEKVTKTAAPSLSPSAAPSLRHSEDPSLSPSAAPSLRQSATPSLSPSEAPSLRQSATPSLSPSAEPSLRQSATPSLRPSAAPSLRQSATPSLSPSAEPSLRQSATPSLSPSEAPSELDECIEDETDPDQELLQKPPYTPKNVDLLRFPAYPAAIVRPPATALASAWQGSNLKPSITNTMAKLYQAMDPSLDLATATRRGEEAASVIDDPTIIQYIPDARLRTALAMLKGTAADNAIDVVKSGTFDNVSFVDLDPGTKGMSVTLSDGTIAAWINSRYKHEDPRLIAPILSHELLHQEINNSLPEETIAASSDTMIYAQHVLADATLPLQKTELTQRQNMKLMARTNCRDALTGNLRITSCNGDNLYPNSNSTLKTFADGLEVADPSRVSPTSPGNNYLRTIVQKLTGQDLGPDIDFSNTTLAHMDENQKLFNYKQLVKIARNLELDVDA